MFKRCFRSSEGLSPKRPEQRLGETKNKKRQLEDRRYADSLGARVWLKKENLFKIAKIS